MKTKVSLKYLVNDCWLGSAFPYKKEATILVPHLKKTKVKWKKM